MSSFTIDAREIIGFGAAMIAAPAAMEREMAVAADSTLVEGIALAQANAPVDEGILRNSIGMIERPSASGGSFGTDLEYAWMREEGGMITARNAPYLHFKTRDGNWVRVRSVTQTGTHYMGRAVESLEGRVSAIYGLAIDRALASVARAAD